MDKNITQVGLLVVAVVIAVYVYGYATAED